METDEPYEDLVDETQDYFIQKTLADFDFIFRNEEIVGDLTDGADDYLIKKALADYDLPITKR